MLSGEVLGQESDYLEVGVEEYWRFEPTGELYTPMLQGERRAGRAWEPIEVAPDAAGRPVGPSRAAATDGAALFIPPAYLRRRFALKPPCLSPPDSRALC